MQALPFFVNSTHSEIAQRKKSGKSRKSGFFILKIHKFCRNFSTLKNNFINPVLPWQPSCKQQQCILKKLLSHKFYINPCICPWQAAYNSLLFPFDISSSNYRIEKSYRIWHSKNIEKISERTSAISYPPIHLRAISRLPRTKTVASKTKHTLVRPEGVLICYIR